MKRNRAEINDPRRCKNCRYYNQHYVLLFRSGYRECFCGHCIYPRLRTVQPDQVCEWFCERDSAQD